jgi:hypothetical protein
MSDVYVEYKATASGEHSVWRIFVAVPGARIDQYRQANNERTATDQAIARRLSEEPARTSDYLAQLSGHMLTVSYPKAIPALATERAPLFEQDGMTFWAA